MYSMESLVAVKALSDVFMSAYQGSDRNRLEFKWGRRASWDQAREEFPKKTIHDPSVEQLSVHSCPHYLLSLICILLAPHCLFC